MVLILNISNTGTNGSVILLIIESISIYDCNHSGISVFSGIPMFCNPIFLYTHLPESVAPVLEYSSTNSFHLSAPSFLYLVLYLDGIFVYHSLSFGDT